MSIIDRFRKKEPLQFASSRTRGLYDQVTVDDMVSSLFQMKDPDETLKHFGIQRRDLQALEYDDEITAAIDTRVDALLSVPWRLEPGTGGNVRFIWEVLEDHLHTVLKGAMKSLLYGYSVMEISYKRQDNNITIDEIFEKPFWWFSFDKDRRLVWRDRENGDEIAVEEKYPLKFLLTQHRATFINPRGEAMLSRLYWPWYFRTNGWKFWAKALERTATPLLKGTAPLGMVPGPDGTQMTSLEAMNRTLQTAVQNACIAVSEGYTVEYLSAPQTGASYELFENACKARIQRLILGQTLTSDTGNGSGSYALGQVHNEVRMDRRNSDIRMVTHTVEKVIGYLWTLNGFGGNPPEFIMEDGKGLEGERAARDAALLPVLEAAGVKLTSEYFLDCYDYEAEHIELAEDTQQEPASVPVDGNPADAPAGDQPEAEQVKVDLSAYTFAPVGGDQKVLDDNLESLIDDPSHHQMMAKLLKPVLMAIRNADDYHQVRRELAGLYPAMKTKELEKKMTQVMLTADLWGRMNADKR